MTRETGWLQDPLKKGIEPLFRRMFNIDITGLENVPETGPALIAPNHLSFIDSAFLMAFMPRRCWPWARPSTWTVGRPSICFLLLG